MVKLAVFGYENQLHEKNRFSEEKAQRNNIFAPRTKLVGRVTFICKFERR